MTNDKKKSGGIVYSTSPDFKYSSQPHQGAALKPEQQNLKVFVDRKNRGGKTVTIIAGFIGKLESFEKLARELKSKCGVGGTVKDFEIIIQGDHRKKIVELLTKAGYKVKDS